MGTLLAITEFSDRAFMDHALATMGEIFHLGLSEHGAEKAKGAITFFNLLFMLFSLSEPSLATFVKLLMPFVRNGEQD